MKSFDKTPLVQICCILTLLSTLCPGVVAQRVSSPEIRTLLTKRVEIKLGLTTVADFVSELSKQTGTPIKAEAYLQEHQISVYLEGVSAAEALNSISEMHHWRWVENNKSEIVLTHNLLPGPTDLSGFPKAFRAVFPAAWLPLLGEGADWSKLQTAEDSKNSNGEEEAIDDSLDPAFKKEIEEMRRYTRMQSIRNRIRQRLAVSQPPCDLSKYLFPVVRKELIEGKKVPYTQWTTNEREASLKFLLLDLLFHQVASYNYLFYLNDNIPFYLLKPEIASLTLRNGILGVGYSEKTANSSSSSYIYIHSLDK